MEMTFYCKEKGHNPWPHLENVWWLGGTKFFGVLQAEMPLIVSFGKAQIIAYSCVSRPIHLSERILTSSGLASEEGAFDVGSSAVSVPWVAPSRFLSTWPGWNRTGWVRLGIHVEQSEMCFLWSDIDYPQGRTHCLSLSDALLGQWDGQNRNTGKWSGSGNLELSRK